MTTITHSTTLGVKLDSSYTNPVVIETGITVSNSGYPNGVYTGATSTTLFTVQNNGIVAGSTPISGNDGLSSSGVGIYLAPGGSVTNAASASITGGSFGVDIADAAGTVVNDGSIQAGTFAVSAGIPSFGVGVSLHFGGSVFNAAAASIIGALSGVKIGDFSSAGVGAVLNYGQIAGYRSGVEIYGGGSVTNAVSGTIKGQDGVDIAGANGTIVNAGVIVGASAYEFHNAFGIGLGPSSVFTNLASGSVTASLDGVAMAFGGTVINDGNIYGGGTAGVVVYGGGTAGVLTYPEGSVTNLASGTIAGIIYGVSLQDNGTVTNAGSIIGNGGTAVDFLGTGSNLLVLDPGFSFSGEVVGSPSGSNVLELASGGSTGTVSGLGTDILHFGSITFDAGADWLVAGVQRGLAGLISGFTVGDTIEVSGITATGSSYIGGVLTLDEAGGGSVTLDLPGSFTSVSDFRVTNVAAGADVTVLACFAAGTRILTSAGAVPVEALTVGDSVPTAAGCLARIIWLGHQRARAPLTRVQAGAFGNRIPARDLLLSPDHAVFVDGALVPVRHLINGSTIVQEPVDEVSYYHVELAAHDVILAEGLPCESYLDTGNRAAFDVGETAFKAATREGKQQVSSL